MANYDLDTIGFMVAPLKTPSAIIQRLNQALVQILAQPEVKERLAAGGSEAVSSTPAELGAKLAADEARMRKLFPQIGIKLATPAK